MSTFSFSADNSAERALIESTSYDVIVPNSFIQRQGNYFLTRHVQGRTEKAICFSKAKGGVVWFPKSAVHVVEVYTGRVDVWVSSTFCRKHDKPYDELLAPIQKEGRSLPTPFDGEKTLVSDPTVKFGGTRFQTRCIARETERAVAFFNKLNDKLVWLPKSQIHVEQHGQKILVWVSNWLVDEKRNLHYLED
jgi:hypothetical protein